MNESAQAKVVYLRDRYFNLCIFLCQSISLATAMLNSARRRLLTKPSLFLTAGRLSGPVQSRGYSHGAASHEGNPLFGKIAADTPSIHPFYIIKKTHFFSHSLRLSQ